MSLNWAQVRLRDERKMDENNALACISPLKRSHESSEVEAAQSGGLARMPRAGCAKSTTNTQRRNRWRSESTT